MVEEITRELIQQIVQETIQTSSQTWDPTGIIAVITVSIAVGGLAFSIYKFSTNQQSDNAKQLLAQQKFNESQKQHNDSLELSQKQFHESQKQKDNLEFVKRLEYYDAELTKIADTGESTINFNGCLVMAARHLLILERLSYLKIKELLNQDFIQYFENDFHIGKAYLKWIEITSDDKWSWDKTYNHFRKIKDTLDYPYPNIRLSNSSFYYYIHQSQNDPDYNPEQDKNNPATYTPTKKDIASLKD